MRLSSTYLPLISGQVLGRRLRQVSGHRTVSAARHSARQPGRASAPRGRFGCEASELGRAHCSGQQLTPPDSDRE